MDDNVIVLKKKKEPVNKHLEQLLDFAKDIDQVILHHFNKNINPNELVVVYGQRLGELLSKFPEEHREYLWSIISAEIIRRLKHG